MKIILASQSPRRLELMHYLTNQFEVIPSDFPEREVEYLVSPETYCRKLAFKKAECIAEKYPQDLIIGSDTLVVIGGKILNKPKDRTEARQMIHRMQGTVHQVITAFALLSSSQSIKVVDHVSTKVRFASMTDDEIEAYLDQGDYMGKAGAYAIQGAAAKYVECIEGDYYTVVGLPVARLYKELKNLGLL